MKTKQILRLALPLMAYCYFPASQRGYPEGVQKPLVRLAELEIFPEQLGAYRAALKQEISTSVREEPGVLTLYAVSVKDHPEQIRLFEEYRDDLLIMRTCSHPTSRSIKSKPG